MKLYQWDGDVLTLTFPQPVEPASINKATGMNPHKLRRLTRPWHDMAVLVVRQALRRSLASWTPTPVTIAVDLSFRTNRRRDPHNYTGTVVKALVDGLVRGGLIPDDTPEWATVSDPTFTVNTERTEPLRTTVTITPRS